MTATLAEAGLALLRDAAFDALVPALREVESTISALQNDDDAGAVYHAKRALIGLKDAAELLAKLGAGRS
jgi:hypothetical protein